MAAQVELSRLEILRDKVACEHHIQLAELRMQEKKATEEEEGSGPTRDEWRQSRQPRSTSLTATNAGNQSRREHTSGKWRHKKCSAEY